MPPTQRIVVMMAGLPRPLPKTERCVFLYGPAPSLGLRPLLSR